MWLMNNLHNYEMKKIWLSRLSLLLYTIFETILGFTDLVLIYYYYGNGKHGFSKVLYFDNGLLGFYLIFQSFALIFSKKTRDPIERISKIGYLQLISINQ